MRAVNLLVIAKAPSSNVPTGLHIVAKAPSSNVPTGDPASGLEKSFYSVVASFQKLELWIHLIWEPPVYMNVDSTPVYKIYTEGQRKCYPKTTFSLHGQFSTFFILKALESYLNHPIPPLHQFHHLPGVSRTRAQSGCPGNYQRGSPQARQTGQGMEGSPAGGDS